MYGCEWFRVYDIIEALYERGRCRISRFRTPSRRVWFRFAT